MAKDILLDEDNDLAITNGDYTMQWSDSQNLNTLMLTNKGMLKNAPLIGPNLINLANARFDIVKTEGDVKQALDADNWQNGDVSITEQDIYVTADRND